MSGDTLSLTFTMPKVKTLSISHCVKYKVKHWSNTNGQWFIFKYLPLKRFSGKGPMTLYDSFVKYLPPLRYCSKYLKNESQLRYCWQPLPWHLHYVRCPTLCHSQQASREPQKRKMSILWGFDITDICLFWGSLEACCAGAQKWCFKITFTFTMPKIQWNDSFQMNSFWCGMLTMSGRVNSITNEIFEIEKSDIWYTWSNVTSSTNF